MSLITSILAEYIGTFVFLFVIIATGKALPIALALLLMILIFGNVSGGHMNPAVSIMMFVKGDISLTTFTMYVIAQVFAGITALYAWKLMKKSGNLKL